MGCLSSGIEYYEEEETPSMTTACSNFRRSERSTAMWTKKSIQNYVKASTRFIQQHPWVLVVPIILLAICVTAGVIGVLIISNSIADQRKEDALNEARGRASIISSEFFMASLPCRGLANYVLRTPNYDWLVMQQDLNQVSVELIDLLTESKLNTNMALSLGPGGIVASMYPLATNEAAIGLDLLRIPSLRGDALQAIITKSLTLTGPFMFVQGYMGAAVRLPIFVDGTLYGPNYTFNAPNGTLPYDCPECFGPQRFWGFAMSAMSWDAILNASNLISMSSAGYLYRLVRPPMGLENVTEYTLAQSDSLNNLTLHEDFISLQFQVLTSTWTLYVYRNDGWNPSWRWPLVGVVVAVSFIIAMLVTLIMGSNSRLRATTVRLEEEKLRLDALLVRQFDLIKLFGQRVSGSICMLCKQDRCHEKDSVSSLDVSATMDKIMLLRKTLQSSDTAHLAETQKIEIQSLLGWGSFGKVYRGLWRGTVVAVKCLVLPANMSSSERAEKMAVMEAAISSTMCHPHVVQTYTYAINPLKDIADLEGIVIGREGTTSFTAPPATADCELDTALTNSSYSNNHGYEMRLVLEYCDRGSLREILDQEVFLDDIGLNYAAILETAADVAKGMLHLHANQVLHADLKAGNVMLKSGGNDGRGVMAKVMDFGLSIKLGATETHVSKLFQGTITHMAPEVLMEGKQSKAADVYAFGILLYELFTGGSPYPGVAHALLGHMIARDNRRPVFPMLVPADYRALAERCWDMDDASRPTFAEVLTQLQAMRSKLGGMSRPLRPLDPTKTNQAEAKAKEGAGTGPKATASTIGTHVNTIKPESPVFVDVEQLKLLSNAGLGTGPSIASAAVSKWLLPRMATITENDATEEDEAPGDGAGTAPASASGTATASACTPTGSSSPATMSGALLPLPTDCASLPLPPHLCQDMGDEACSTSDSKINVGSVVQSTSFADNARARWSAKHGHNSQPIYQTGVCRPPSKRGSTGALMQRGAISRWGECTSGSTLLVIGSSEAFTSGTDC